MKLPGLLLFFLFILSISVFGQLYNRSFELAAEPNTPYFIPPLYWNYENYAGIQNGIFDPNNPDPRVTWTIPPAHDGNYYLLLSTGGFGPYSDSDISFSSASQQVYLPAGTLIRGVYFFGTCDWQPYDDFGVIELKPVPCNPNNPNNPCDPNAPNYSGNLTTIQLAYCSVKNVGDYGSTEQWIPFSRTILPQEKGVYDLILHVEDVADVFYESYFAVDDLAVCGPQTPLGDLTCDCTVDLQDLSLFSRQWLKPCYSEPNIMDPNNIPDPNCLCADFSKDYKVDANDLDLFRQNWLLTDL
jgi:hypothetical protein